MVALALALSFLSAACHTYRIEGPHATISLRDHAEVELPIRARSPGQLLVRYLGSGGLYIEWAGAVILTGPYFTNPGLIRAGFGRYRLDETAVRAGLGSAGMDLSRTSAVFVGHSHYDHLGDVPLLMREFAPRAVVVLNQTGAYQLASEPDLAARARVPTMDWEHLRDAAGRKLPVRYRALVSGHAGQAGRPAWPIRYAHGQTTRPWSEPWSATQFKDFKDGSALAFLVDLLDPEDDTRVLFRIHYQDAAAAFPDGAAPTELVSGEGGDARPVDLQVVCAPGYWTLKGGVDAYPRRLLEHHDAGHVLVIHYEDFFDDYYQHGRARPQRTVFGLARKRMRALLSAIDDGVDRPRIRPIAPPPNVPAGLYSQSFTVPLVGEWLQFDVRS